MASGRAVRVVENRLSAADDRRCTEKVPIISVRCVLAECIARHSKVLVLFLTCIVLYCIALYCIVLYLLVNASKLYNTVLVFYKFYILTTRKLRNCVLNYTSSLHQDK